MNISDLWPILIALLSAFIGYQFSRRAKGNDSFIVELTKSYENSYYPMYIQMKTIKEYEMEQRDQLVKEFIEFYSLPSSTTKSIASTSLLEMFFELRQKYLDFVKDNDEVIRQAFWESFEVFYSALENEFWQAHYIIYKDYHVFKTLITKNQLLRILMELSILVYNVTTFLLYITGFVLYLSIWNYFKPLSIFPSWWTVKHSLFLSLEAILAQLVMLTISSWYVSLRNKRKSILLKKLNQQANRLRQFMINRIRHSR